MQFQLTEWTRAVLTAITTRTENHGDEKVPAITLSFGITGPNTILDHFGTPYDFRHAIYMAPEGQEQLEGIDSTPLLRTPGLGTIPLKVNKLEGWTLHVDHGIDEETPIDMGNCSVSKFKLDAFQGGSCELSFIVSTDDVDAEYLGLLGMKLSQELSIRLTAPEAKPDAIDGTKDAFDADHPDAGDLFAEAHASGDEAQEDGDGYYNVPDPAPAPSRRHVAKYRNEATGETWSGKGLQPKWLKTALSNGAKLEDFESHAAGAPA